MHARDSRTTSSPRNRFERAADSFEPGRNAGRLEPLAGGPRQLPVISIPEGTDRTDFGVEFFIPTRHGKVRVMITDDVACDGPTLALAEAGIISADWFRPGEDRSFCVVFTEQGPARRFGGAGRPQGKYMRINTKAGKTLARFDCTPEQKAEFRVRLQRSKLAKREYDPRYSFSDVHDFLRTARLAANGPTSILTTPSDSTDGFTYALSDDAAAQVRQHLASIAQLLVPENVRRRPTSLRVITGGKP